MTPLEPRQAAEDVGRGGSHDPRAPGPEASPSLVDEELAREVSRLLSGNEKQAWEF